LNIVLCPVAHRGWVRLGIWKKKRGSREKHVTKDRGEMGFQKIQKGRGPDPKR